MFYWPGELHFQNGDLKTSSGHPSRSWSACQTTLYSSGLHIQCWGRFDSCRWHSCYLFVHQVHPCVFQLVLALVHLVAVNSSLLFRYTQAKWSKRSTQECSMEQRLRKLGNRRSSQAFWKVWTALKVDWIAPYSTTWCQDVHLQTRWFYLQGAQAPCQSSICVLHAVSCPRSVWWVPTELSSQADSAID